MARTVEDTALFIDHAHREASISGRSPTFSLSTHPIPAATDSESWDRARTILDRVLINRNGASPQRQSTEIFLIGHRTGAAPVPRRSRGSPAAQIIFVSQLEAPWFHEQSGILGSKLELVD
jgi:alkanesulfonate monooxygenase SsuD/methylene tetrahydromethanopterin reductase-like flavin-dependent oxidoreductase (luciferase family)